MASRKPKTGQTSAKKSVSDAKQFDAKSGVRLKTAPKVDPKVASKAAQNVPKSTSRPKPPPPSSKPRKTNPPPSHWKDGLRTVRDGSYKQSFGNVQIILNNDPAWKGVFAYDEFIGDIVVTRSVRWDVNMPAEVQVKTNEWSEQDTMRLRGWLDRNYGIDLGTGVVGQVIRIIAEEKRVHAVRTYLENVKWDEKPRLDSWLSRIGGAEDDEYTRAVGAKLLIGAVARVFEPGCKNDCMVVFEGAQGAMKSSMIEALFSRAWYSGTPFKMGTKDGYQTLRRKWGLEVPELSHFDRSGMNEIKAFLSQPEDNYRPSYGVKNADFPRQSVCVGTTNDTEWHKDTTGGRRFWPIYLHGILAGKPKRVDMSRLRAERDQLWAEAVVRYKNGEAWHLKGDKLEALAERHIERRRQVNPWEVLFLKWLGLSDRWAKYVVGEDILNDTAKTSATGLATSDVLDAVRVPDHQRTRADEMRAGSVLRALGFERRDLHNHAEMGANRYAYLATEKALNIWTTFQRADGRVEDVSAIPWRGEEWGVKSSQKQASSSPPHLNGQKKLGTTVVEDPSEEGSNGVPFRHWENSKTR